MRNAASGTCVIKYFFLIGFLFSSFGLNAQQKNITRSMLLKDFVFKGNHIDFNFSVLSAFKSRLKGITGNYPVSTTATPGLVLSFKYRINFNNYYSLITGAEAIVTGRNFVTSFNKNDFSPPLDKDYKLQGKDSYLANLILSLPVLLEKRILYRNTKFFFGSAGIRFNVSTGADFDIFSINLPTINNSLYDAGEVNVYANNDAKPWLSFPLNAGHSWLLKNNNLLQLGVCANISFTKYVNGTYRITIPGQPETTGKYSSTGSYIGVSLNYIFTNANYRIRKEYEKIKNIH
jgi:hypothetical protein